MKFDRLTLWRHRNELLLTEFELELNIGKQCRLNRERRIALIKTKVAYL